MNIMKRSASSIPREEAHGGSGARKVYASPDILQSGNLEAMTHGFLPAGNKFDWHEHIDIEEIMCVTKGSGIVADVDGEYDYAPGDVFIFPANTQLMISNTSN